MRILVLTDLYPPHFVGGYELQCKLHAEELARRGHEVCVLTSRWKVRRGTIEDNVYRLLHYNPLDEDLRLKRSPPDPLRILRRYNQFKWALACRRNYTITRGIVATLRPDIAYIWNMGSLSISPVLAAQQQGIPIVFNVCDYWLALLKSELRLEPNPLKRRYRAMIVDLGDFGRIDLKHILVNSRSLMQSHVEIGFPEQNISVIPLGIPSQLILDIDDLPDLPHNSAGKAKLAFVGRLVPEKGPDVAVEALAYLVREMGGGDIELDIIGTGPDEYVRKLKNMVTTLGLQERVEFTGKLEHRQVLDRYAEYDALLFPSLWVEPFGLVITEAMAQGVPVIATNHGGPLEIISDGESGLLVPPGDPVMLANAVKRLLQNPDLGQKIRYTALKTIRQHYTLRRIVDQTEEYLQMVLRQACSVSPRGD